jgi:uncharacterized protein (TIGR04255 family)
MAFPDAERVIYEKNPLDEVVCKLNFPSILRIDAEPPVSFQEQVRGDFPFFQVKSAGVNVVANLPAQLGQAVRHDLSLLGSKAYVFDSADRVWSLQLTKDVLALSCRRYERWERFRERLTKPLDVLAQTYNPAFFTHVCLRYRDVIRRSRLELQNTAWLELLQPWISGPLGRPETTSGVQSLQTRCVIALPNGTGHVDATYGLAVEEPNKEPVFVMDAHLYNDQQKGLTHVFPSLDALNVQGRRFFRWCITDRLHRAMGPVKAAMA